MIDPEVLVFPYNAIDVMAPRLSILDSDLVVHKRQLRPTDERECIGIFAQTFSPLPESMEMRGRMTGSEPTLSRYIIPIQSMVKDMDEERGLRKHAVLSKLVRGMLYRDSPLGVSLRALSVTLLGSTEQVTRYGISAQRYISNEIRGQWLFVSITEFWLETATE